MGTPLFIFRETDQHPVSLLFHSQSHNIQQNILISTSLFMGQEFTAAGG